MLEIIEQVLEWIAGTEPVRFLIPGANTPDSVIRLAIALSVVGSAAVLSYAIFYLPEKVRYRARKAK